MDTVESSNLALAGAEPSGLLEQIRQFFARLFGGGVAPTGNLSGSGSTMSGQTNETAGEFVIAPCGYAIRVPQASDVSPSVSEMVPSVREGLSVLPPLPAVAIELLREIQDPKSTAASVAAIAASDPSLAASIIRMVNGAAMGLARKITSVHEAINYLGFGVVKAMVLRLRLEEVLAPKNEQAMQDAEDLSAHSLAVSYVGERIAREIDGVDAGFVATLGLLHDIGKLAITSQLPREAALLRAASDSDSAGMRAREVELLGVDHAGVGATLALNWKLPADLVQAIRWHHRPANAFLTTDPPALRKAVHIVQIANQLAKYCCPYADRMEIDMVSDEAFALLGLEPSLEKLLDPPTQAAISRAIHFADSNSRRPATAPRRFLRPLHGVEATRAVAAAGNRGNTGIELSNDVVAALFRPHMDQFNFKDARTGTSNPRSGSDAHFTTEATAGALRKCLQALRAHQDEMNLTTETRQAAALTVRCLLSNLLPLGDGVETIEITQALRGRQIVIGVRSPILTASRRLGTPCDASTARRLAEADFANILNLGWFSKIAVSTDGSTVGLWSK